MSSIRLVVLFLLLGVFLVLSTPAENLPVRQKRGIPDAVGSLVNNVNDNLKDIIQRLGNLLNGSNSLPPTLLEVLKDVVKILGGVVEALGRIVGIRPRPPHFID